MFEDARVHMLGATCSKVYASMFCGQPLGVGRLVTSRENVSLQLQKQGGPYVLRLVQLSLNLGGSDYLSPAVKESSKEHPVLGCYHKRIL